MHNDAAGQKKDSAMSTAKETPPGSSGRGHRAGQIKARFVAISWRDVAVSFGPIVLVVLIGLWLAIYLIRPAPP